MGLSNASSAVGLPDNMPPQVARFKVAHYVGNYLELTEVVVSVIYDLLADRRTFTLSSGERVRGAFGISERDILERWADVKDTTLDAMTPENAHTFLDMPAIWPTLYEFVYANIEDPLYHNLILRWIHTAMVDALDDAEFEILFQFQLNLLDQWFILPHEEGKGITFDQLLQLLQAVAAFREIVYKTLDFSFEDLKFTEKISGDVSLKVDGVVLISLPEEPEEFLTWRLKGATFSITLHFDEIALADVSEFSLIVDIPFKKLTFPFGGTTNALRFLDVDVGLVVDPEHGKPRSADFAPYHQFSDAYFMERDGESLGKLDIQVGETRFSLASTVLTSILTAGVAYINLWTSDDIDDLEQTLADVAAAAFESLDDFSGLVGELTDALSAVIPNAPACSTHDIHKPYLNDHYALTYDEIRVRAEPDALIIENDGPSFESPDDYTPGGVTHFPPTDWELNWPGILDGSDPDGGRNSRLSDTSRFDAARVPAAQRAEYERRLAAAGPLPPEQEAAARLLIDGLDVRTLRFLNRRQIDLAAGTVAGVRVAPMTLAALARLTPAGSAPAAFPFAAGGRLPSAQTMFAQAATPLQDHPPMPKPVAYRPSNYAAESTLDARRGSAIDPGWIGLSVNSYAVDKVLGFVAGSGLLETAGSGMVAGPVPATEIVIDYETAAPDTLRLFADLSGKDGQAPTAVIGGLEVTLSRSGAEARYAVSGRAALAATRLSSGCLPDSALLTVVQFAGCITRLTGGAFSDADYRDDLLYRHFIYVEPQTEGVIVTDFELLSGNPDDLTKKAFEPRPLLLAALRGAWANVARVPVLFDPYYALSPDIRAYEARDGWLNVYEQYSLAA